jgi:hypothetical protein
MRPNAKFILLTSPSQNAGVLAAMLTGTLARASAADPAAAQEEDLRVEVTPGSNGPGVVEVSMYTSYVDAPRGRMQAEQNRDADANDWPQVRGVAKIVLEAAADSPAYYTSEMFRAEELLESDALRERFELTDSRIDDIDRAWAERGRNELLSVRRMLVDLLRPRRTAQHDHSAQR